MKTTFKVLKKGKYIEIGYVTDLNKNDYFKQENIWLSNKKEALKFIEMVRNLENRIEELLIKTNNGFKISDIITKYYKVIDAIASGFDIRSKMSIDELSEMFIDGYTRRYNEAVTFCNETLAYVEEKGKFGSYSKDWRRYDKHNSLIVEFNLNIKKLTMDDFNLNELSKMYELLTEMSEIIKKK